MGDLGSGEEVGVEEVAAEGGLDEGEGLAGRMVFRDVARGVTPDEGEARASLEGDGSDEEVLERGVGAREGGRGFSEGEFDQRAVGEGGAQEREEAVEGGRL